MSSLLAVEFVLLIRNCMNDLGENTDIKNTKSLVKPDLPNVISLVYYAVSYKFSSEKKIYKEPSLLSLSFLLDSKAIKWE